MPKSSDSVGKNNSRPFLGWVVIHETWWLPLAGAWTGGQRDYKGVIGSHRVPQEATGSHADHRALAVIRGHVSKNKMWV